MVVDRARAYAGLGLGVMMHFGLATFVGQKPWEYHPADHRPEQYRPAHLDPEQWVVAAKSAGARYVCLTAKHHDGFALWHTKTTEYGVQASPCTRDVIAEFTDAAARHDLRFVLYYSWFDKSQPEGSVIENPDRSGGQAYLRYAQDQLTELLTGYGPVDAVWLDIPPRDDAQLTALRDHITSVQPECLFMPNLVRTDHPAADIRVFEAPRHEMLPAEYQGKPAEVSYLVPPTGGQTWGWWQFEDNGYPAMTAADVARLYAYVNGTGATLTLNVSPSPTGRIDPGSAQFLADVGTHLLPNTTTNSTA